MQEQSTSSRVANDGALLRDGMAAHMIPRTMARVLPVRDARYQRASG